MYKGRHCTESDYVLLVEKTDEIISLLFSDEDYSEELTNYIDFISDFDKDIASKIRLNLDKDDLSKNEMVDIIATHIHELKRNVVVDIQEHR